MMREREEPVIAERDIPHDRPLRVEVPCSDRIWSHLEVLELGIELGFEHLCHTFRSSHRVGELSLLVREPEREVFMLEDLRESFEKSLKHCPSRAIGVIYTYERSLHHE